MISDVKVYPLKKEHKVIKANGTFVVNESFKVKFTLLNGTKGPFVGFPGKYGDKPDPETGKKTWYSDVTCIKDDVRAELTKAVLAAYNEKTGNTLSQGEADGPSDQTVENNIPY